MYEGRMAMIDTLEGVEEDIQTGVHIISLAFCRNRGLEGVAIIFIMFSYINFMLSVFAHS